MDPVSAALPQNLRRIFVATLVQDHINSVRDRENEVNLDGAFDDNEVLDVNNSTFTTKVLQDGQTKFNCDIDSLLLNILF